MAIAEMSGFSGNLCHAATKICFFVKSPFLFHLNFAECVRLEM